MAERKKLKPVAFEDCRILFRNFSGKPSRYNPPGKRNFNLVLDNETAVAMLEDGWNVKYLKPRDEGDEPLPRVEVEVDYTKGRPPRVVIITSRGKTQLDESLIDMLDYAEIAKVDMIINPFFWEVNGNSGVKAYLGSIYVTIREDELELKYADVPDAQSSVIVVDAEIVDEEEPRGITRGQKAITDGTPF